MILVHCDSAFCQNLEGTVLWHTLWKLIFLRNYLTKFNGILCKMQVISYSFITWNYTLIYVILWKLLMRKVRLYFFWDIRYTYLYLAFVFCASCLFHVRCLFFVFSYSCIFIIYIPVIHSHLYLAFIFEEFHRKTG